MTGTPRNTKQFSAQLTAGDNITEKDTTKAGEVEATLRYHRACSQIHHGQLSTVMIIQDDKRRRGWNKGMSRPFP